ncbi:hypothetical protein O4G76_08990 [Limimaricola sp. G21655-S1]|uniref:hypothetical protein n=1 Tax=Limimaricola sp. G21655-S1 TaxID=3014768 RepID=UPI0022B043D7|nr:hypothetical protein [Limimaricola sp. G21655-S1]MCZ4260970.1 hypothetical protein [Limimaricola sp. G21655-S1]
MTLPDSIHPIQPVTRRAILGALPVAALGATSAAALGADPAAMAPPEADPIITLYQEWAEARAQWVHLAETSPSGDADEPDCEAAWDRKEAALFEMMRSRATSVEGIRLLAHVMWEEEGWTDAAAGDLYDDPSQYDALRLLRAIIRSAEGMAA